MKYLVIVLLIALGSPAHAGPILNLEASSSNLGFNEAFTVDVLVSGIEATDPLLAFGFDINALVGLVQTGVSIVAPFLDDSAAFATTDVAGSTFPAVFGNDILLGTLQFTTAAVAGFLDISIGTSAGDLGFSEGLFTSSSNFDIGGTVTVEVSGGSPVPLPSTLLLACLGLLAVGVRGRLVP